MVVVDSSVIIPLLRIGKIEILFQCFERVVIPEVVWQEVVIQGKELGKTFSAIDENAKRFKIVKVEDEKLPAIKGLQENDLRILATAKIQNDILLTNDATLYDVALSQNIKAWWLTGLVLYAVKIKKLSPEEGRSIVLELVNAGACLKSDILARVLLALSQTGKKGKGA